MATEGAQVAPTGDAAAKKDQNPQGQTKNPPQKGQAAPTDAPGEKKLSNAELKKKAKEEKAARRAQAKLAQGAAAGATTGPVGPQGAAADAKSGKGKANVPKQGGHPVSSHQRTASRAVPAPAVKEVVKPKIPECFSHLSMARRIAMTQADKDVTPTVLALGQQMSTFEISDSITRLEATLLAFKRVPLHLSTSPVVYMSSNKCPGH